LVGAGHAHLGVLAHAAGFARRGVELVVVTPEARFWYSGLATGVLGGRYPVALDVVDVGALAARGGGRCLADTVVALDPRARRMRLAGGGELTYDVCSLDVGSTVACDAVPGAVSHGVPVKPVGNLAALRGVLVERGAAGTLGDVVVAGAGASGVEVAANVDGLLRRHGLRAAVTVVGRRVLPGLPPRAARGVVRALAGRGVEVRGEAEVQAVEPGRVLLDGGAVRFGLLVMATGLAAAPLARASGLPVDDDGALLTDEFLRSTGDPAVFGGGDAIAFRGSALARIGVHAVRQAPVLAANLLATLDGRPPTAFLPQRRWLLVMNLGDGTALATRGRFHYQGRLAWRLKDRIDRRWMARWHALARVGSSDAAPPS